MSVVFEKKKTIQCLVSVVTKVGPPEQCLCVSFRNFYWCDEHHSFIIYLIMFSNVQCTLTEYSFVSLSTHLLTICMNPQKATSLKS